MMIHRNRFLLLESAAAPRPVAPLSFSCIISISDRPGLHTHGPTKTGRGNQEIQTRGLQTVLGPRASLETLSPTHPPGTPEACAIHDRPKLPDLGSRRPTQDGSSAGLRKETGISDASHYSISTVTPAPRFCNSPQVGSSSPKRPKRPMPGWLNKTRTELPPGNRSPVRRTSHP